VAWMNSATTQVAHNMEEMKYATLSTTTPSRARPGLFSLWGLVRSRVTVPAVTSSPGATSVAPSLTRQTPIARSENTIDPLCAQGDRDMA